MVCTPASIYAKHIIFYIILANRVPPYTQKTFKTASRQLAAGSYFVSTEPRPIRSFWNTIVVNINDFPMNFIGIHSFGGNPEQGIKNHTKKNHDRGMGLKRPCALPTNRRAPADLAHFEL